MIGLTAFNISVCHNCYTNLQRMDDNEKKMPNIEYNDFRAIVNNNNKKYVNVYVLNLGQKFIGIVYIIHTVRWHILGGIFFLYFCIPYKDVMCLLIFHFHYEIVIYKKVGDFRNVVNVLCRRTDRYGHFFLFASKRKIKRMFVLEFAHFFAYITKKSFMDKIEESFSNISPFSVCLFPCQST